MKVYFMYDNHTFSPVGGSQTPRQTMQQNLTALFQEDGCGVAFARNSQGSGIGKPLHGRRLDSGRYGATTQSIDEFLDAVEEELNWECR